MNIKKQFSIFNFQIKYPTSSSINFLLVCILVLSAVLRLYKLGEYPIHLTNDEAGIGYNAYSILKTARDEHGEFLPVIFKSFGDWKPGLYIYATVPSVLFFGLTEFAVRFPSAVSGILSVFLVYVLANKLFSRRIALFASLTLAINPWHIHFSRGGWEANLALALLLLAVLMIYKSFENKKLIGLSAIFFALTLWTYQSAKLASVLVLLALALVYYKQFISFPKKYLRVAAFLGILLSLPILLSVFTGKSGRLEVMSVFSYERPEEYIQESILDHEDITRDSLVFKLFHSEAFNFTRGISGRYLNYFSGKFLFFEGDWSSLRHSSPNVGYLLFAEIPVLIIGLHQLFKKRSEKSAALVLLWLALAPIPAAITRDSVHGVRALNMIIPLVIALGFGLNKIIQSTKPIFYVFLAAAYVYSMLIYMGAYYVQNAYVNAENYFYGYRETVKKLDEIAEGKKIIFSQSYDQPYIFFLFYSTSFNNDPAIYQNSVSFIEGVSGDVGFVERLGYIEFRAINWAADKALDNTLIVGKKTEFPMEEVEKEEDYNLTRIEYPDGNDAFLIVEPI